MVLYFKLYFLLCKYFILFIVLKVVVTAAKKMGFRNTKFDPSLNAFPPNNRNIDVDVFWYDLAI